MAAVTLLGRPVATRSFGWLASVALADVTGGVMAMEGPGRPSVGWRGSPIGMEPQQRLPPSDPFVGLCQVAADGSAERAENLVVSHRANG